MTEMPPYFDTDLYVPTYLAGDFGAWRVSHIPLGTGLGYWVSDQAYLYKDAAVLANTADGDERRGTWMSMTPIEIESSEWGVRPAWGDAVIMGFGMGWTALAMACRPKVNRVTVVERDPEVVALFDSTVPPANRPAEWDKVNVVISDAVEWRPDQPVDFMFADIWPVMGQAENLDHVRRMTENARPKELYYWGQELDLTTAAIDNGWNPDGDAPLTDADVDAARASLGLPLYIPAPAGKLAEGAWREWARRMQGGASS